MKETIIPIFYACDDAFVKYTVVSMYSLIQNASKANKYVLHILYTEISDEMKDIEIEISVLTPLKRINDISEFKYGQQGIYMRKGYRSGTFLPQVAHEVNWTKEEFLGHCAQDKAGIGWYGWKDAELYTYEAILFEE